MYTVTKTYGHDLGLSACFRQWRAEHSHCQYIHGYALSVELEFAAEKLTKENWVIDFGGLKPVKEFLVNTFDHKLLVASDDPKKDDLLALAGLGLADGLEIPVVGCEGFSFYIYSWVSDWLDKRFQHGRTHRGLILRRVTVREHGANAASYGPKL